MKQWSLEFCYIDILISATQNTSPSQGLKKAGLSLYILVDRQGKNMHKNCEITMIKYLQKYLQIVTATWSPKQEGCYSITTGCKQKVVRMHNNY